MTCRSLLPLLLAFVLVACGDDTTSSEDPATPAGDSGGGSDDTTTGGGSDDDTTGGGTDSTTDGGGDGDGDSDGGSSSGSATDTSTDGDDTTDDGTDGDETTDAGTDDTDDTGTDDTTGDGDSDSTDGDDTTGGDGDGDEPDENQLPPTGDRDLRPWLQAGSYLDWTAESSIHRSAGPHLTDVRTYINDAMLESFEAGNRQHPVGVALVKELYNRGSRTIDGYAVMVKVSDGTTGADWYWYEILPGGRVVSDGTNDRQCTGCHSAGIDFVRTPFPLQ